MNPKHLRSFHISITGIVQGVGFRPFIYTIAKKHSLRGWVNNTSSGVEIEIEGDHTNINQFIAELENNPPPLARIDNISVRGISAQNFDGFKIIHSTAREGDFIPISPDVSICVDCLGELFDEHNRRYLYPFINCTNCGPRFTIIEDIPYDRPKTTMAQFTMCDSCNAEYTDPLDRRFHAQPIACPDKEAIHLTQQLLQEGKIVAIKGLGGFHLACNALNQEAVNKLRVRKHRISKPFAVMMPDTATVEQYCYINEEEKKLLASRQRPIVILDLKKNVFLPSGISPNQKTIGVMLPYTPLHYMLFYAIDDRRVTPHSSHPIFDALIMTSGNISEEPIAFRNDDALSRLSSLADAFLLHNRPIHIRCDDSVTRIINLESSNTFKSKDKFFFLPIRRSRGYAPDPIILPLSLPKILAVGAELKNTFCLTRDKYAFMSHYIGDLENYETYKSFTDGISHFQKLFRINPDYIAYDLHPNYLSTQYALEVSRQSNIPAIGIQHHHAHIASCMIEHSLTNHEKVIGLAFDGTGFGDDQAIWGGEIFVTTYRNYQRIFHLAYTPLIGGNKAIKEPWRMALSWLHTAGIPFDESLPPIRYLQENTALGEKYLQAINHQLQTEKLSIPTSSIGRLFDAVASIIGIKHVINYEAQAAIEFEALAEDNVQSYYQFNIPLHLDRKIVSPIPVIHEIIEDLNQNVPPDIISAKFHNGLAKMALDACIAIRDSTSINKVVLSGGVWQNVYLLKKSIILLEMNDFEVLIHNKVPTNDGGISLGQAVIAGSKLIDHS